MRWIRCAYTPSSTDNDEVGLVSDGFLLVVLVVVEEAFDDREIFRAACFWA